MKKHLRQLFTDSILALLIWSIVVPFNWAWADMPAGGHLPPCGPAEVGDRVCLSYVTAPDGSRICAPDGMKDICVPISNLPNDPNNSADVLRCQKDGTVCEDATPSKVINGISVSVAEVGGCWKYRSDYTCLTPQVQDTCGPFREDSRCAVQTRRCINQDGLFGCLEWELGYQCLTKKGSTETVEFCGDTQVCVGGVCWETGYEPDKDFVEVVTNMEIGRQIGVYSPDGLEIFAGESTSCRSKRGAGLKNCCGTNTQGQDKSNNAVMGEFISGAAGFAARAGTKFVFDTLYEDTLNWVVEGMSAATSVGMDTVGQNIVDYFANPSFGMYGFSIGGTGAFLGTTGYTLVPAGGGFPGMYFNPYAFAVAIAIQVIMSAMTCDQDEAMLAMKRGADLCSPKIGDWCTKAVLGVCITRRQSYCCYNSKFARIINVQGRQQLGMGWGDPKDPTCSGFTAAQLAQLDFSEIDMSELVDDIMKAYDPQYLKADQANAEAKVNQQTQDLIKANCERAHQANPTLKLPKECEGLL